MKKTARVRAGERRRKHRRVQKEVLSSHRICYSLLSYKTFFFFF